MPTSRKYCPVSSPKRQRMSTNGDMPAVNYKEVVAVRRLQRVWRSTFRHMTTKTFVVRYLDPEVGLPLDKMKTIRLLFCFLWFFSIHSSFCSQLRGSGCLHPR